MTTTAGRWREDQVLIICPGSQTTLAQLGCNELTPPQHRIPTRMFWDGESRGFRPIRTYRRKKQVAAPQAKAAAAEGQNEQAAAAADGQNEQAAAAAEKTSEPAAIENKNEQAAVENKNEQAAVENKNEPAAIEYEWVEDPDSEVGAIYPLACGHIVDMPAFLAFLDHVHAMLVATHHNTPIMLMASMQWTRPQTEKIARYIFEKTRTPALCMINSGIATHYGLKWPHMTVIDVGYEKVDITCVYNGCVVSEKSVTHLPWFWQAEGLPRWISGGQRFTENLHGLLRDKGFTLDMAEQLKRSPICEVLPMNLDRPEGMDLPAAEPAHAESAAISAAEDDDAIGDPRVDDDGVLDVASIVASGQTQEFLAKNRAKGGRRGKDKEADAAAAAKAHHKLANAKKVTNTFHYEEIVDEDVPAPAGKSTETEAGAGADPTTASGAGDTGERMRKVRRDIQVGLERFTFANRDDIDRIADSIYRTVQGIYTMGMRPACWDNLVFVGNGARLRGLRENVMQTLYGRYLIAPSTATIFTSELPSNIATPTGTGSQTPTGSFTGPSQQLGAGSSGVNPLLQAATAASAAAAAAGAGSAPVPMGAPIDVFAPMPANFRGQTPTSIRLAPLPTYLGEWTKHGFEEASFLGCLVAARLAYCQTSSDPNTAECQRQMSLTRVEYNEIGPKGIRWNSLLK